MPVDPQRVQQVFLAAVDASRPAARGEVLDRECGDDRELRHRVEVLLTAHDKSGELPAKPLFVDQTISSAGRYAPGTVIAGRYKLLEEIAEGGMGTVWVADQTEPVRRRVAIKLIKPGMDTRQVLSRFEAERQALALMDHPNIARVLDGGMTDDGRPFFAMEYVKGVPITQFCDDASLPVSERLQLFTQVCQAVQHAHQKGIIHRDLKPSNILVCLYDGKPVPRVIDFGLAKAMHQSLTERTLYTAHGLMVGTPLYMSPEQAEFNNLDIDTRTDVYSLGVILYELLTGSTPLDRQRFKDAALQEIVRLIKEQEPSKPSTKLSSSVTLPAIAAQRNVEPAHLSRLVRGDLDWIVMKALEKERSRRYETANGMARDIERFLSDQPVEACPPSAGYRFRKFARRNKAAFATSAAIVTTLLLASGISTWQAIRATRAERRVSETLVEVRTERDRANEERDRAVNAERRAQESLAAEAAARIEAQENLAHARDAVEEFFTLVSQDRLFDQPSLQPLRLELLEAAIRYYEALVGQRPADASLLADLAIANLRITPVYRDFDRADDCIDAVESGLDQIDRLRRDFPAARDDLVRLAGFWKPLRGSGKERRPEDVDKASRTLERLVATYAMLHREFPSVEGFESDLAAASSVLGDWQMHFSESRSAGLAASEEAMAHWERLITAHPDDPDYYENYLETLANIEFRCRFEFPEKGNVYRARLMEKREEAYLRFPAVPRFRAFQILVLRERGSTLEATGRMAEACQAYQQELEMARELCREFPRVIEHTELFLSAAIRLVRVAAVAGVEKSRIELIRREVAESIGDARRKVAFAVDSPDEQWRYSRSMESIGVSLMEAGETGLAAIAFHSCLDTRAKLAAARPEEEKYRRGVSSAAWKLVTIGAPLEELDKLTEVLPDEPALWILSGRYHALRSRWEAAAVNYGTACRLRRSAEESVYECAGTLLLAGRTEEYEKVCGELIDHCRGSHNPFEAFVAARTCALKPNPSIDPAQLVSLAQESRDDNDVAWSVHVLGLAHYRAGEMEQAIARAEESNGRDWSETGKAQNALVLAMAHHRMGNDREADRWLKSALDVITAVRPANADEPTFCWHADWIELMVLSAEATTLIRGSEDQPDESAMCMVPG